MKQRIRLYILIAYIGILFTACYYMFGSFLPPTIEKSVWFLSGIASAILGNLLVTPFYTKPADTISYSVVALVTFYTMQNWSSWGIEEKSSFIIIISYIIIILLIAIVSIAFKDSEKEPLKKIANTCQIIIDVCGNHGVLFSLIILFSVVLYHRSSFKEYMTIMIIWVLLVVIKPEEYIFRLIDSIKKIWVKKLGCDYVGVIAGYVKPNLLTIRQSTSNKYKPGDVFVYKNDFDKTCICVFLNYIGKDEDILFNAIDVCYEQIDDLDDYYSNRFKKLPKNIVVKIECEESDIYPNLVGTIDVDSNIEYIFIELIDNVKITEGMLLETKINNKSVIYQVVNGTTTEDVIYKRNKYGYARAKARKIGVWNNEQRKFECVSWVPCINAPVYIPNDIVVEAGKNTIGNFPESKYFIDIENINELVTHNTAILGILGIGKSMLSIELIERLKSEGIKVVCLDLTNQYANELADFYNKEEEETKIEVIIEAGQKDQDVWKENPDEGGSVPNLCSALYNDLKEFIDCDNKFIKIYNPAQIMATKQKNEPKSYNTNGRWNRGAGLWSLTPVEITRIISEQLLELCQDTMTDKAKVCLVLEEAHSLVPEFTSVASEGDKIATNGTARVILQGRKYGLGCLLITQRTANVTKTILNQCNTIFAMRTFDDTSKNFLSNFIGKEYTEILPSLKERQAVFYGKGSSCENPVILRLNDRDKFISRFRK